MKPKTKPQNQANFLFQDLLEHLNPKAPLLELARRIPWDVFEKEFADFYKEGGRPAKPIRLMVGLLILRQMENLRDERVVEVWVQNPFYQAFCGERVFHWRFPCDPSDLTYFRRRIGEEGVEKIFEVSVRLHGKAAQEGEVMVDTTVQEKNITFPTDAKLLAKVIRVPGHRGPGGHQPSPELPAGIAQPSAPEKQKRQNDQTYPHYGRSAHPGVGEEDAEGSLGCA